SGADAAQIVRQICPFLPDKPESHRIYYGFLTKFEEGNSSPLKLDEVLLSYFEAGRSFTGEQTLEISCHGGRFLSSLILQQLVAAGARVAQPGEFTQRAFLNQRIDLVQAEAVLELIESENFSSSQLALRQLQGGLSKELRRVQSELTQILAHLEANIDFAAEDIVIASDEDLLKACGRASESLESLLQQFEIGRKVREGLSILMLGVPNAGKSSLLNQILQDDRVIVTEQPGTTRDLIHGEIEIGGMSVQIFDSAGFRETLDQVEKLGIEKMLSKAKEVDFVAAIIDAGQEIDVGYVNLIREVPFNRLLLLFNKEDLLNERPKNWQTCWVEALGSELWRELTEEGRIFRVSAVTGEGLDHFDEFLKSEISRFSDMRSGGLMNARHFHGLKKAQKRLRDGIQNLQEQESPEIIASDFQLALNEIYQVLGDQFDDQVMDQVFRSFCLGK
ncbi:MAG: tRNA uridine-5-carboxymethylaminomethyl(34) synthesis GTPase MnmE, partial [Bdellovibrionales bacterium]|nr:tRNA uridine-5-carboxymethylaminomethyl(34) synthesis GTPase MnmE [Bdellovibrionales bacterium]